MAEILEQLNNLKELGYIQKAHLNVLEVALEDYKTEIRAKAIDEFAEAITAKLPKVEKDERVSKMACVADMIFLVDGVAEQIKAGGKNEID